MPILRKLMVTALAAGAVIAAPAAALASAAPPSHAAGTAVAKVHRVPCTSRTFNVYYDGGARKCYEGTGAITFRPPIQNVHRITTGGNTGFFFIQVSGATVRVPFHPLELLNFAPEQHAELLVLDITRT